MLVMDEPEPTPPPAISAADQQTEAHSLIITGKRSRRKVNLSAEFLYHHPARAQRLKVNDDEVSHGGDAVSPLQRKRRRSSAGNAKTPDELIIKRNRLQQRKLELEAYLKRLQVALAVERNHANGIGPPPGQLVAADPLAAAAAAQAENGGAQAPVRSAATARRKSFPSVKKKESRPAPPPLVDDDNVDISLKACIRIVDDLIHNQYGDVFATPVDWVALGLPSYPEIIKEPMDLGTIRNRLSSSHYATLSAFIADVQLVWDNAKKFNLPKSFVHEATLEMERIWNRKKDYLKRERRKAILTASKGDVSAAETVVPPAPVSTQNSAPAATRPLSLLEMSKLRADLVRVPSELYSKIAEIIGSTVVNQPDSEAGGVLHVDVDKLMAETQRQLQQFVASVLPKSTARPRPAAAPARKLSNSMTSVATAVISSESDSDSSSSSGLESDSSEDDHVVPPPLPIVAPQPVQEGDPRADEVVNTDAWSNLSAEEPQTEDKGDEKKDPLWSDYQHMSAEAEQRKREQMEKEEARQNQLQLQAQERARLDEKARLEREELEKQRAAEAAQLEEEKNRMISEEREKARRALEHDDDGDDQADMGFLSIFRS